MLLTNETERLTLYSLVHFHQGHTKSVVPVLLDYFDGTESLLTVTFDQCDFKVCLCICIWRVFLFVRCIKTWSFLVCSHLLDSAGKHILGVGISHCLDLREWTAKRVVDHEYCL